MGQLPLSDARALIEAVVTAVSILGGEMAYCSGLRAAQASAAEQSPQALAHSINEGIAEGFKWGAPSAAVALIIVLWS